QFAMVLVACFEAGNAVVLAHLIAHAFQGGGWRSLLFGCLGVTDSLARCYGIILARRDLRFTARGARLQYNGMKSPLGSTPFPTISPTSLIAIGSTNAKPDPGRT